MFALNLRRLARRAAGFSVAVPLAFTFLGTGAEANEPTEKDACIDASEQGQQLRDDGKYQLAREAFMRCARGTCPLIVKRDCVQWLVDLDEKSSTVVLSARGDKGDDLVDVRVTFDGVVLATKLDGEPIHVDLGAHRVRYEAPGFVPVEEQVVIHAGEKNRIIEVELSAVVRAPSPSGDTTLPAVIPPTPVSNLSQRSPQRPLLAAELLGGAALVAFASEAYFGISGLAQRSGDLSPQGCAPRCTSAEVGSIQTKFAIADVSLGAGIVSAALATYFFLRPAASTPTVVVGVGPLPDGAAATVGSRF